MLARNPLLLTLMATLHSNRTRLPDDRADLYNEVVDLLLAALERNQRRGSRSARCAGYSHLRLSQPARNDRALAFDAHAASVGQPDTADIPN